MDVKRLIEESGRAREVQRESLEIRTGKRVCRWEGLDEEDELKELDQKSSIEEFAEEDGIEGKRKPMQGDEREWTSESETDSESGSGGENENENENEKKESELLDTQQTRFSRN